MVTSASRVRSTSNEASCSSRRSRSAMSSVISFSLAPDSDVAPRCAPPWPGSSTMRLIGSGSTARARRCGAASGASETPLDLPGPPAPLRTPGPDFRRMRSAPESPRSPARRDRRETRSGKAPGHPERKGGRGPRRTFRPDPPGRLRHCIGRPLEEAGASWRRGCQPAYRPAPIASVMPAPGRQLVLLVHGTTKTVSKNRTTRQYRTTRPETAPPGAKQKHYRALERRITREKHGRSCPAAVEN